MKKFALIVFCFSHIALAQYVVQSPYLDTPSLAIGYVDSCAKFWTNAYEPTYGGFYTNIDRKGNLIASAGTSKNTLNQSRDAYGFTRAFMLTGNEDYLVYARHALDFMYKNAWDKTYGGWFNDINNIGTPSKPTDNKTAYCQHYALLGITASYEATRDTNDWSWLMRSYALNDKKFWDSRPQYFGYYDNIKYDGTNPADKSFNATVDAITTHVLHLYLMTGDSVYKARLLQLADNMLTHLVASVPGQTIGFAEICDANWAWKSSETMTIMGHVLKTAWCLARIYQLNADTSYLSAAEGLVKLVWDKGYDHQLGGPYKDYNRVDGKMLMWGVLDTAKAWWQMEQAVTAGLMLYQITGKFVYLQMADESLDFFMKYFVDHVYGDVYADRTRYGKQVAAWGDDKGNSGKAGYHSIELGYYVYLYGNLLLKHEAATLYYNFRADSTLRNFRMTPISLPDAQLRIKEVKYKDSVYANVDNARRILTIPPGVGGTFSVTYESAIPSFVALSSAVSPPTQFELAQNYPNPFNPTTTIRFAIPAGNSHVRALLKIYDVLGREVATLTDDDKEAGTYQVTFDASSLTSGVYFYRMSAGNFSETKKMLLLR